MIKTTKDNNRIIQNNTEQRGERVRRGGGGYFLEILGGAKNLGKVQRGGGTYVGKFRGGHKFVDSSQRRCENIVILPQICMSIYYGTTRNGRGGGRTIFLHVYKGGLQIFLHV